MKNNGLFVGMFGLLVFGMVTIGCSEEKDLKSFDGSISEDKCATFIIPTFAKVKRFDNTKVNWAPGFSEAAKILVPAGTHTITLDYKNKTSLSKWSAKDIMITYEMTAGKFYIIKFNVEKAVAGLVESKVHTSLEEISPADYYNYLVTTSGGANNAKSALFSVLGILF
jgi:hypothetical protein